MIETSCCSSISEIFGLCPGAGSHPTYPKPQETSTGCLGSPRHTLHGGFPDFLKQKITEGSSSNIETQPSTLFASAQERPGRRGHQTTQPSLQSLDLLVACIWRPNGPSLLAVLPLAYSPLWYVHPSHSQQAALISLSLSPGSEKFGVRARTQVIFFSLCHFILQKRPLVGPS